MTQAETARIHERLDEIVTGLSDIKTAVKARDVFCDNHSKKADRHERILLGNGTEGLTTTVATLAHSVNGVADEQKKGIKWLRGLVASMIVMIGGFVTQALGVLDKPEPPHRHEMPNHVHSPATESDTET